MPTESGKPLIVISYAHTDEPEPPAEGEVKWLSFVTGYLRPAIKHLGGDALLIVPSPYRRGANYGGMADFFREAPISQQHGLWREVGRHAKSRLSDQLMWLS